MSPEVYYKVAIDVEYRLVWDKYLKGNSNRCRSDLSARIFVVLLQKREKSAMETDKASTGKSSCRCSSTTETYESSSSWRWIGFGVRSTHSSEQTANMILVIGISIMPWRVVNHSRTNNHERRLSALKHVNLRLWCVRMAPMVSNVGESLLQTSSYSFLLSFQRSFSTPKIHVEIFLNLCGLGLLKCVETTRESIEKRSSFPLVRCALLRQSNARRL